MHRNTALVDSEKKFYWQVFVSEALQFFIVFGVVAEADSMPSFKGPQPGAG